jgi:hypothetical protein
MRWLWKDWRLVGKAVARAAQRNLIPGEEWELVAEGFDSPRPGGQRQGEVLFTDIPNSKT